MMDYGYIFSKSLWTKLKDRVYGNVICKVNEYDQLYIRINSNYELYFEMYIDNISDKIRNGYSTDYAVFEIVKKYEKFIHNRFMKRND